MCLSIFMLSRESADSEFPSRAAQLLYQLSLLEESSGQQVFPNQEPRLNLLMEALEEPPYPVEPRQGNMKLLNFETIVQHIWVSQFYLR